MMLPAQATEVVSSGFNGFRMVETASVQWAIARTVQPHAFPFTGSWTRQATVFLIF